MIAYMAGCSNVEITDEYISLKNDLENLKNRKKDLLRKTKLIKKLTEETKAVSEFADKASFEDKMSKISNLLTVQRELKNKRNRLFSRICKNNSMINEINSISINIPEGRLMCSSCGSTNIVYQVNKDISFKIASDEMKKQIIKNITSLNTKLDYEIGDLDRELSNITKQLQELLKENTITPVDLILYKQDLNLDINFDQELVNVENEYENKKLIFDGVVSQFNNNKENEKTIKNKIVSKATEYYRLFDKDDDAIINEIFTKSSEVYSGSESTIFFISRLLAFEKELNHKFPIIIDGFREGELSTPTEKKVIDCFKGITKQIILTATLKDEEYHKYDNDNLISKIDFSDVESKHLLKKEYVNEFSEKLSIFNLSIISFER